MKKILIINGHPNKDSYCKALSEAYARGTEHAGHEVVLLNLNELNFDPNFLGNYSKEQINIEKDLLFAQEKIKWAQHLVIVHPVWWGSVPAVLKGFFDKTLLPGFAFKYRPNSALWDKLLAGRTGSIIYTTDTPIWINRFFYRAPAVNMVRDRVMGFCGIKTIKVTGIGPIRKSTKEFRENWLVKVEKLGNKGT